MNTLDWFPWYWKNWRLSEARETMGGVERGIYRELLDYCWSDGSIPNDTARLAKLTGHDEQTFRAAWAAVSPWFEARKDGRLYNHQMSAIRTEQMARYDSLSMRGKRGAKKRWDSRAIAKPKPLQVERQKDFLTERGVAPPAFPEGSGAATPNCNCGGAGRKSGIHSPSCPLVPADE